MTVRLRRGGELNEAMALCATHFASWQTMGGSGENARYGTVPGISFQMHLTDQHGPHHTASIWNRHRLHVPDVPAVLADRAIGGKLACTCHVEDRRACPALGILPHSADLLLALDV